MKIGIASETSNKIVITRNNLIWHIFLELSMDRSIVSNPIWTILEIKR